MAEHLPFDFRLRRLRLILRYRLLPLSPLLLRPQPHHRRRLKIEHAMMYDLTSQTVHVPTALAD